MIIHEFTNIICGAYDSIVIRNSHRPLPSLHFVNNEISLVNDLIISCVFRGHIVIIISAFFFFFSPISV